jgi:hypothetical protein
MATLDPRYAFHLPPVFLINVWEEGHEVGPLQCSGEAGQATCTAQSGYTLVMVLKASTEILTWARIQMWEMSHLSTQRDF